MQCTKYCLPDCAEDGICGALLDLSFHHPTFTAPYLWPFPRQIAEPLLLIWRPIIAQPGALMRSWTHTPGLDSGPRVCDRRLEWLRWKFGILNELKGPGYLMGVVQFVSDYVDNYILIKNGPLKAVVAGVAGVAKAEKDDKKEGEIYHEKEISEAGKDNESEMGASSIDSTLPTPSILFCRSPSPSAIVTPPTPSVVLSPSPETLLTPSPSPEPKPLGHLFLPKWYPEYVQVLCSALGNTGDLDHYISVATLVYVASQLSPRFLELNSIVLLRVQEVHPVGAEMVSRMRMGS